MNFDNYYKQSFKPLNENDKWDCLFFTVKHPNIIKVLCFGLLYSNFKGEVTREIA